MASAAVVPAAAASSCPATQSMTVADWQEAGEFAVRAGEQFRLGSVAAAGGAFPVWPWPDWARAWLPLGQLVSQDLQRNLAVCPEATVAAVLHALPAVDEAEGSAASSRLIKLVHHFLDGGAAAFGSGGLSGDATWKDSWLLTVASFVRFVYLKWVTVDQGELSPSAAAQLGGLVPLRPAMLRQHNAFLFQHSIEAFLTSGVYDLQITENSVLFSEALAFVSFCKLHDADVVIESGVYKGVSSEIWSLFSNRVVAVDVHITAEARDRLQTRANVQLVEGDGLRAVRDAVEEHSERKVAVFVDGPKGEIAIRLALELRRRPNVAFVAIHDTAPYREELLKLGAFFFSDEPWFQEAYGHLDAPFRARPDIEAGGTMAFL